MDWLFYGVIVFYALFFLNYRRLTRWVEARKRKRHPGHTPTRGVVGTFDEIFHPNAYQAALIWEAQQELPVPAPDSDDTRPDLASGRIRIILN